MNKLKEKFIIFSFLFEDEYGKVYRAYNKEENRKVWIKELHNYILKEEKYKKKVLEKAEVVKNLNHRNIQKLYDYWEENGKVYFELENLSGTFMDEVIFNPKTPDKFEVIYITYQLFSALSYAHSRGIIHENVRPEHITIERNGDIKITNFMMTDPLKVYFLRVKAKVITDEKVEYYRFVRFTSPWHLKGDELDWRSDFFSAAVTIFELATKETPWDRRSPSLFCTSVYGPKPVRYLWQFREDLPPYFSLIIFKCMTDYEYRRDGFKEEILEIFQSNYDDYVKPILEKSKERREFNGKVKKLISFVMGTFLSVGLLLYPVQKKTLEGNTAIPVSVLPLENKTGDPSLTPIATGITEEIIHSISYLKPLCVIPSTNLEVTKKFNLSFVLENEIKGKKNTVFVSKLFKAKNGKMELLWSSRFSINNISSLKQDMERSILQALKLDSQEDFIFTKKIDHIVYNLYLNSLYWHNIFLKDPKKEYLDLSRELLLKASEVEKNFSPIYSGLAANALLQLEYGFSNDPDLIETAKKNCFKALEIDKEDLRARTILSFLYLRENKKIEAYKELLEIYNKNPKNLIVNGTIGTLYQNAGLLDKAIKKYKKVKKINPIDRVASINIGRIYIYQGKFLKAEKELRGILKESENPYALSYLSLALCYSGKLKEAENLLKDSVRKYPEDTGILISLATLYSLEKKVEKANEILKKIEPYSLNDPDRAYRIATCYSLKNDKESAIKWLKIAIKNGNENCVLFKNDPFLDNLRECGEFENLMRELEKKFKIYKKEFIL